MRTQEHKPGRTQVQNTWNTPDGNEVKYFCLSHSLFNYFGSEGIAGHLSDLSDLDRDGIFLLEKKT